MNISEMSFSVNSSGELRIPADIMQEMGLKPQDTVFVAYIADNEQENHYREFLLSPHPLNSLEQPLHISVPIELLDDAHIPADADVQIVCVDGAIIICGESALQVEELSQVLKALKIANELSDHLPEDANIAVSELQGYIDDIEEEMYHDDDGPAE